MYSEASRLVSLIITLLKKDISFNQCRKGAYRGRMSYMMEEIRRWEYYYVTDKDGGAITMRGVTKARTKKWNVKWAIDV